MIGKRKKANDKASQASATEDAESNDKVVFGFRTVFVFDVSQTEGKELPEFASLNGDPGDLQTRLEAVIAEHGIGFSYVDSLNGAAE